MPRRLSNIEWATFLTDIDVPALNLPPWGGIVEWGAQDILVFVGARRYNDVINDYVTEIFLTDVTDMAAEWKTEATRKLVPSQDVFVWTFLEEVGSRLMTTANQAGAVISAAIDSTGKIVEGIGTVGENLYTVAIVAAVVFIVYTMYGKKI